MAGQGGDLAGGQVQQLECPVHARAAGQDAAAWVERQRPAGVTALPGQQRGGLPGGQIPQPDGRDAAFLRAAVDEVRRLPLAAGYGAAVGAEGHRLDLAGASGEGGDLPGGDGPQRHLVGACDGKGATVGAEGRRYHVGLAGQDAYSLPGSKVPKAGGDITAAGKGAPVRAERHAADRTGMTDQDHVRGEGRDRRADPGGHSARPGRGDGLLAGRRGACGTLIDPPQGLGIGDLLSGGKFAGRLLARIAAIFCHGMLISGGFPRSAGR